MDPVNSSYRFLVLLTTAAYTIIPTSPFMPFTTTATSMVEAWSAANDPRFFTISP